METWDAIRSRRNVRSYQERELSLEQLDRILEAGRISPSSGNEQRWDFVLVRDRQQLESLSKVWRGAGHIAHAAAAIAVVAPIADDRATFGSIQYDLGQVTMCMMLAAADMGVGTAHASVHDQSLAAGILGFPDDRMLAWLIGLGYPADRPLRAIRNHNRRPFHDVVHRERW